MQFSFWLRPFLALALGFLLPRVTAWAQPAVPAWEWVSPVRAQPDLLLQKVALDGAGNAYVIGHFNGRAEFGPAVLTSRGRYDLVVAKYDARGRCLWARQAGPPAADPDPFGPWVYADGVAVDRSGNVYVVGRASGRTSFDGVEVAGDSNAKMFLAKYSPQGAIAWARGYDFGWPGDVVAGSDGAVYATHSSPVPVSAGRITGSLWSKFDAQGNVLWSRGAWEAAAPGSSGRAVAGVFAQLAVGPNREVYFAGSYQGRVALDTPGAARTPLPDAVSGVFLARYTAAGTLDWVRTGNAPGAGPTSTGLVGLAVHGLAVDGAGNAYLAGNASAGGAVFGNVSLPPRGGTDVYLLKYDARGQLLWGHQEGSAGDDGVGDVATDGAGNAYLLAGFFKGQARFGRFALTGGSQYQNMALVKYDPAGEAVWALTQDGGEVAPDDVAVSPGGDAYVVGDFYAPFRLGAHAVPYASAGGLKREGLVAKLQAPDSPASEAAAAMIPNIITPNRDGVNDRFETPGLALGAWSCAVYTRWGKQVYYAAAYQQDWQAEGLSEGLYYYRLATAEGRTIKGWVEVRR